MQFSFLTGREKGIDAIDCIPVKPPFDAFRGPLLKITGSIEFFYGITIYFIKFYLVSTFIYSKIV